LVNSLTAYVLGLVAPTLLCFKRDLKFSLSRFNVEKETSYVFVCAMGLRLDYEIDLYFDGFTKSSFNILDAYASRDHADTCT